MTEEPAKPSIVPVVRNQFQQIIAQGGRPARLAPTLPDSDRFMGLISEHFIAFSNSTNAQQFLQDYTIELAGKFYAKVMSHADEGIALDDTKLHALLVEKPALMDQETHNAARMIVLGAWKKACMQAYASTLNHRTDTNGFER